MGTTEQSVKASYGAESEGCWFDGSRGQYIGEEVISTAIEHGWDYTSAGYTNADRYCGGIHSEGEGTEFYCDMWQAAEDFMQQFAEPGYWFGSHPDWSDWGLYSNDSEEDTEDTENVPAERYRVIATKKGKTLRAIRVGLNYPQAQKVCLDYNYDHASAWLTGGVAYEFELMPCYRGKVKG